MADEKPTGGVSRAEFYSIAGLAFILPPLFALVFGHFPEDPLRQVAAMLILVSAVGMSMTFSIKSIQERRRQAQEKDPGA